MLPCLVVHPQRVGMQPAFGEDLGQRDPLVAALGRIERDRLPQRRNRLIETSALPLRRCAHHPARTKAHIELERGRQRLHRFVSLSLPVANHTEIVMSELIVGLQPDRFHHRLLGFGETSRGLERVAEIVPGARIVGPELQRLLEAAAGPVEVARGRVQNAHQVVRFGVLRRKADGFTQHVERGRGVAGGIERLCQREMRGGVVRALRERESHGIDFYSHGMVRKSARALVHRSLDAMARWRGR